MPKNRPPLHKLLLAMLVGAAFQPFISTHAQTDAVSNHLPDAAPALLLAQNYSSKWDASLPQYLVSEKLDGVRAFWDGQQLRFRSGGTIHAPAWFTAALPKQALDGELWMGRQSFDKLSAAVRRSEPQDNEWKKIRYYLYELPNGAGSFSERYLQLQAIAAQAAQTWVQVAAQDRVANHAALQAKLDQIVKNGGEGLMLHRADAAWQTGRSDVLLKLKPQLDTEGVVVAYEPGKGKYQDMLGALWVVTPDGKRFRLGTGFSDEQRRHPPAIGATITYRYRDLTSTGLPKFASFLRVRESDY